MILIDEIGRLNGELQLYEEPRLADGAAASDELASTLRSRLRGLARR